MVMQIGHMSQFKRSSSESSVTPRGNRGNFFANILYKTIPTTVPLYRPALSYKR